MQLIKSEKFKSKKIKVKTNEENDDVIVQYGDVYTVLFQSENEFFEIIQINDLYDINLVEKLIYKTLDYIQHNVATKNNKIVA